MIISGLAIGGAAAIFLALSYIFSGLSVRRFQTVGAFGLLCRAHVVMGVLSVIGLCFVHSPVLFSGFSDYVWSMTGSVLFYLAGQTGLFFAQKTVDSSRIVPLLGTKLLILALINTLLLPMVTSIVAESYSVMQWCGILMTVISALLLNQAGGSIPLKGILWIIFTCLGYALSDTCIAVFLKDLRDLEAAAGVPVSEVRTAVVCAFVCYVASGVVGVVFMPVFRIPKDVKAFPVWYCISPFALFWLTSMLFLYTCFGKIGTVNGNIVQSTRGIIAIGLGWLLAKMGFTALETKVSGIIVIRRLLAALLMLAAIALFNLGRGT